MNKLRWLLIGIGLWLLKKGLRHRLSGKGAEWLQPFQTGDLINREAFLISLCRNKKIFHLGFADAPFTKQKLQEEQLLHLKIKEVAAALYGIDTDQQAVEYYQSVTGDDLVAAIKLEELPDQLLNSYDIVLAGEILEHIKNPSSFIELLELKMKKEQLLVVTVPNYISLDNLAAALHQTESIHPDHHWYFSPYTIQNKFESIKWSFQLLRFANYGKKDSHINFIKRTYAALGDCIVVVLKKR